ncbi:roadblock/LC7 domain-containing protein [Geobacter hydrogenophilus]|uniref:GTPase n=1 Tax=Geobacter hydrogenophilus TaxID=40983 RepID=A0A9W6FXQ9_9BACT|nr:roadblock/LC7 domain-containing protein [Geobacter hydrogenophilus]MBT0895700.1 roadblock/LC7 domain-containing protein [Geobacter hydrogenophilus]GLI36831.1 GTPase [Geobacter hydrogenophilus]
MSFKAILTELVQSVPGATGAIIADWEGETVDHVALRDDYELKITAAHLGIILTRMKELQGRLSADPVREAVITLADQRVILGPIGDDYLLVLTLDREAIAGRAMVKFEQVRDILLKEIY